MPAPGTISAPPRPAPGPPIAGKSPSPDSPLNPLSPLDTLVPTSPTCGTVGCGLCDGKTGTAGDAPGSTSCAGGAAAAAAPARSVPAWSGRRDGTVGAASDRALPTAVLSLSCDWWWDAGSPGVGWSVGTPMWGVGMSDWASAGATLGMSMLTAACCSAGPWGRARGLPGCCALCAVKDT